MKVDLYTDGACSGNPGPGGWGAILQAAGKEKTLNGGEPATTNNRMEMMAVIRGLGAINRPCDVTVFTDSRYVMDGINSWMANWKKRGWRTASGKPVKNQDLWEAMDAAISRHTTVRWEWVKGHAGHAENERADALARAGIP